MKRSILSRWFVGLIAVAALAAGVVYFGKGDTRQQHAESAADRRDFDTTLKLLEPTLTESRPNPESLILGARSARRAGRLDIADRYLRKYQERGGDAEVIAIERMLVGVQAGKLPAANGLRFCDEHPGHVQVPLILEAVAEGSLRSGDLILAGEAVTRWLATNPSPANQAKAYTIAGTCSRHLGQIDRAAEQYLKAVDLDPDNVNARLEAASVLADRDPATALKHANVILATQPNLADALVVLARAERNQGHPEAAKTALDRVLAAQQDHRNARVERAKLAIDQGDAAAAEQDLRQILVREPRALDVNSTLVRALQLAGRDKEAEEVRKQVREIEAELFRDIEDRVKAGKIPAPPPGTTLPGGS